MQVFLSYSHADAPLAREVTDYLRGEGLRVWNAEDEILPGDNWAARVGEALEQSDAMVVLLTPHSFESQWIMHDIQYALGNLNFKGRLVPVIVGSDEMEAERLPWVLKRLNVVRLPDENADEQALSQIAHALAA